MLKKARLNIFEDKCLCYSTFPVLPTDFKNISASTDIYLNFLGSSSSIVAILQVWDKQDSARWTPAELKGVTFRNFVVWNIFFFW